LYAAKHAGRNRVHLYGESLRSFHRVRMRCEGMYRAAFPDLRPITIREISEGGVLFDSRERLPDETLIEVHVPVSPSEPRVVATARVVRVRAGEAGPFEVAARIVDVEPRDARRLSEYLASQRRFTRGETPTSTP
jgi:hypothetical protein